MSKRKRDIPGYTLRSVAEQEYGRSKSSFIRDVDGAFERGDLKFLENFRVYLNDGSMIPGTEATKEKMRSAQTLQPWVYIRTSLLETRYWEKSKPKAAPTKAKKRNQRKTRRGEASGPRTLDGVSDVVQLQHELALAEQKNESLERENEFLQSELKSRRGELDKVGGIIDSLDSLRKGLKEGNPSSDSDKEYEKSEKPRFVDATVKEGAPNFWKTHTPTFHKVLSRS